MGSFEWMELDTLTRQIEHAQSRIDAARATKNLGLVTVLQREIEQTAKRRARVLADLTKALGSTATAKRHSPAVQVQPQTPFNEPQVETLPLAHSEPSTPARASSPEPIQPIAKKEGVAAMWNQLTPADIEHAKRVLAKRRSEMLVRHTEELRALDAEQTEIDKIEQAIKAFAQKFKIGGAEVVQLDTERVLSQAG